MKEGEPICGDCFVTKKVKTEQRMVIVLSDGLGSGVKANVLGSMTASMAANFIVQHEPVQRTATAIMKTLPVDSERQMSYATFTIIDIRHDGETHIVEYGNPRCEIIGIDGVRTPERKKVYVDEFADESRVMFTFSFKAKKEDRIVFYSDGVTQAGMGSLNYPFGWEEGGVRTYLMNHLKDTPQISARDLVRKVVSHAVAKDYFAPKDDISCGVVYFRKPRKMLICTGPPYHNEDDARMADLLNRFDGKKVICGGTTARIVSRELNRDVKVGMVSEGGLPPSSKIEGFDLVTEGILTLGRVTKLLDELNSTTINGDGPAVEMIRQFFESDEIKFLVGTKINEAHQDPNLPVELEIRRNVVKKIVRLLEEKFFKEVTIQYI
ncbi:stage II sporulation protein E [Puteibacter caeruleilacunae]|nr:stage II sporulation protein E [Puteibacter caeruleilacunae]